MTAGSLCITLLLLAGCNRADPAPDLGIPADAATPIADLRTASNDLIQIYPTDAAACAGPDGGAARLDAGRPPTLDEMSAICVRAETCATRLARPIWFSASECVDELVNGWPLEPLAARLVACSEAPDCASLIACFGGDLLQLNLYGGSCDGTSVVDWSDHRFDCCSIGLTCVKETLGSEARCTPGACPYYSQSCDGTRVVTCSDGMLRIEDCAVHGATCALDQYGFARCVGTGGPCAPNEPGSCDGSLAKNCLNGRWGASDCSSPRQCRDGYCSYPIDFDAGACLTGNADCKGDVLRLCAWGAWRDVDCRALGFQTCGAWNQMQERICL